MWAQTSKYQNKQHVSQPYRLLLAFNIYECSGPSCKNIFKFWSEEHICVSTLPISRMRVAPQLAHHPLLKILVAQHLSGCITGSGTFEAKTDEWRGQGGKTIKTKVPGKETGEGMEGRPCEGRGCLREGARAVLRQDRKTWSSGYVGPYFYMAWQATKP